MNTACLSGFPPNGTEGGLAVTRVEMSAKCLIFERWKIVVREDCAREDKLPAFDAMGDYALRLFWERSGRANGAGILE